MDDDYENMSAQLNDDESVPDDTTVASASFMADDDRYDMSQQNTGHRKRKREEEAQLAHDQAHTLYADELLDYFMLHDVENPVKPEPPLNFNADWLIDSDGHSAMHWAAAMGDVSVMKELIKHGANLAAQNVRGETPLMRCVMFTNCQDKKTMPSVVKELIHTIDSVDQFRSTALHHAAAVTSSKPKSQCARYYIDIILNKMQEVFDPDQVQRILDAQDVDGNTAVHIAARHGARKCVRALIGRGASTSIYNKENVTAEDLIQVLKSSREFDRRPARSSSPYQPSYDQALYGGMPEEPHRTTAHHSEAAMSIESKIIPLMHEKFQDLAASFDEEFQEKEISEREARRILTATIHELDAISGQILDIEYTEDKQLEKRKIEEVAKFETMVTGLIEQQQKMQLHAITQHEQSKSNGHMMSEDDVAERAMLAKMLADEQTNRVQLVEQYRNALSLAGAGEKGDMYRRLISKCVGQDPESMDEGILDSLIEQLEEDRTGREFETVIPDDVY
jgi:transcription factor MBP1